MSGGGASVTLLCGFLGAGKTTLLNRLLSEPHGLRMGVLVNDFGELSIDSQLVVGVEGQTLSLQNGCICCTLSDDFVEAIAALLRRPDRPDHILIETSGVSDPVTLARTLALMERTTAVRLDAIVTVVDAEQYPRLEGEPLALARRQVRVADLVLLNKRDLVSEDQLQAVREELVRLAPGARLLVCEHARVPLEILFGAGRLAPERLLAEDAGDQGLHVHPADPEGAAPSAGHGFVTWTYRTDQPLAREPLSELLRQLPPAVYRAKGLVYLAEHPERAVIVHLVGKRLAFSRGPRWRRAERRSTLVFIAESLDVPALTGGLERCRARGLAAAAIPVRALVNRWRQRGSSDR